MNKNFDFDSFGEIGAKQQDLLTESFSKNFTIKKMSSARLKRKKNRDEIHIQLNK